MQPGQSDRVPAVRLTKIAGLTAKSVTNRSGLEAAVDRTFSPASLSSALSLPAYSLTEQPDFARAAALADRHSMILLGYIKRDKC